MASLCADPGGKKRILVKCRDGIRRPIRLGKMSLRKARSIEVYIGDLESAGLANATPSNETMRWLQHLSDQLYAKMARIGLVPHRDRATLKAFLDRYIKGRTDVKTNTVKKYKSTRKRLIEFFGAEKPLRDITQGCADDFRLHVAGTVKEENTVRKHIAVAKLFFGAAKKRRLISENPFEGQASAIRPNRKRFYFVSVAESIKVLSEMRDNEWRLIFVLSRYGGLRCPSEHLGLRWQDIDWERGRVTVHAPKTEHHAGHESRVIPLFQEMREPLDIAFTNAEPGAEFVIQRLRSGSQNWRTQMKRFITRAGLKPWPKIFQNLRSTRQTELEEFLPSHAVTAFMGNSRPVAERHYLQVTDAHFERACSLNSLAQNPAHHMVTSGHISSRDKFEDTAKVVIRDEVVRDGNQGIAGAGLEPARGIPLTGF